MDSTKSTALIALLLLNVGYAQATGSLELIDLDLDTELRPFMGIEQEEEKLPTHLTDSQRKELYSWYKENYDISEEGFFPKKRHYEEWSESLEKADEYIESLENKFEALFPGRQHADFRFRGMIESFLKNQLSLYYRPKENAPKIAKRRKIRGVKILELETDKGIVGKPRVWYSKDQYIRIVVIPDLTAVFGEKNISQRVSYFKNPRVVAKRVQALIKKHYTKIPISERMHKMGRKVLPYLPVAPEQERR